MLDSAKADYIFIIHVFNVVTMGIIKYTTHEFTTPDETTLTVEYRIGKDGSILYGSILDSEGKNISPIIPGKWMDAIQDEIAERFNSDIND